jgi:hypothetical protein
MHTRRGSGPTPRPAPLPDTSPGHTRWPGDTCSAPPTARAPAPGAPAPSTPRCPISARLPAPCSQPPPRPGNPSDAQLTKKAESLHSQPRVFLAPRTGRSSHVGLNDSPRWRALALLQPFARARLNPARPALLDDDRHLSEPRPARAIRSTSAITRATISLSMTGIVAQMFSVSTRAYYLLNIRTTAPRPATVTLTPARRASMGGTALMARSDTAPATTVPGAAGYRCKCHCAPATVAGAGGLRVWRS